MKDNGNAYAQKPGDAQARCGTDPPYRILVVEDDSRVRQSSTEVLIQCGYEVDSAADGADAWEALNTNTYDLLITDNNMPKVSGVDLLKKLRAAHLVLPTIMATGTSPEEEFVRYPWLRPDATLLKPYGVKDMLEAVKKVLREIDGTVDASLKPLAHPTHRILVVDEDRDLRLLYADVLARPGYRVDAAEDGDAGWEALQANNYDLLITEHDLPRLTGLELVRKLRAARMALPVVMAATRLPTCELARDPPLQLAATLEKPFAVDTLLDTVRNVLCVTDCPNEQIVPPARSPDLFS